MDSGGLVERMIPCGLQLSKGASSRSHGTLCPMCSLSDPLDRWAMHFKNVCGLVLWSIHTMQTNNIVRSLPANIWITLYLSHTLSFTYFDDEGLVRRPVWLLRAEIPLKGLALAKLVLLATDAKSNSPLNWLISVSNYHKSIIVCFEFYFKKL